MKDLSKMGLTDLSHHDSVQISGGTINPGEWIMYKLGRARHAISSWWNLSYGPTLQDLQNGWLFGHDNS